MSEDDATAAGTGSWRDPDVPDGTAGVDDGLAVASALAERARALRTDPWGLFRVLATLGAADLTAARAAEPHLDAVAILAQAGDPDLSAVGADARSTFGVYAARAPGAVLEAAPAGAGGWAVSGSKAWCSLAERVSHALVTVDAGPRPGLYAVPLRHPGVRHDGARWVSQGLREVTTGSTTLDAVPAVPVGEPDWYLTRPGFAWGGIGVAAVWLGAARALADRLVTTARQRPPDQLALVHLGTADRDLHAASVVLRHAAADIRAGRADGPDGALLAVRVRSVVADACERVLATVGHALGPAPLTHDEEHARRVADLIVYVRQHHAERDLAALGGLVLEGDGP